MITYKSRKLKRKRQEGGALGSALSGAGGGAVPILGSIGSAIQGIQGLNDKDKSNDGTMAGKAAGSAIDAGLGVFGIPTGGAGAAIGSMVGSYFNKDGKAAPYTPSGNVTGNYRQAGGYTTGKASKVMMPAEHINLPHDTLQGMRTSALNMRDIPDRDPITSQLSGDEVYKALYAKISAKMTPHDASKAYDNIIADEKAGITQYDPIYKIVMRDHAMSRYTTKPNPGVMRESTSQKRTPFVKPTLNRNNGY